VSFQITVEGLTEKQEALRAFGGQFQDAVDEGLREGGAPIVYDLQSYPDEPANSSYTRTFDYMHSITPVDMTIVSPGVFEASGHMPYDIFLRGTSDGSYLGAWMHLNIWVPLVDIVQNRIQGVYDAIGRSISDLAARLGL
jgi:hypothetical protein